MHTPSQTISLTKHDGAYEHLVDVGTQRFSNNTMHSTSKFLLIGPIARCIDCSKGIYSFTISRKNSATLQLERADYTLIKYTTHGLQPGRLLYVNTLRQRDIWLGLHVLLVLCHVKYRCIGFLSDNIPSSRYVPLVTLSCKQPPCCKNKYIVSII